MMPLSPETLEQLHRSERLRLYPSLTNPHWLVLRKRRLIFQKWLANIEGPLDVIDIGGRIQPYRSLLGDRVRRYVAIDIRPTELVDIVGSAEQIPVGDEAFDLVICTQVLQYIPNPAAAISEIHRVLKPGGRLLLSAPSAQPVDGPRERWRFLATGLRQLLSDFKEVEVIAEGGSVAGFFRTMNVCLPLFLRYDALRSIHNWTLCPTLNVLGLLLEKISEGRNEDFAVNHSVLARK